MTEVDGTAARTARPPDPVDRHLSELVRLAYVVSGSHADAARLAGTALGRALARPFAGRDADGTEARALEVLARQAPRRGVVAANDRDRLWRTFQGLPRRRRVALALAVERGMSVRGIADALGCSESGARALVDRARAELREAEGDGDATIDARLRKTLSDRAAAIDHVPFGAAYLWRRRAVWFMGLVVVVVAATVAALRLDEAPSLPRPAPARTSGGERAAVRLPRAFAPVGPNVSIARGSVSGIAEWTLDGYQAEGGNLCLELRVGTTYGDRHCISAGLRDAHAFASPDPAHRLTFIYGNVGREIAGIALVGDGDEPRPFEVVRVPAGLGGPRRGNFFVGVVDGYMLPLTSEDDGTFRDYEPAEMSLLGSDASGEPSISYDLLLGRPRPD